MYYEVAILVASIILAFYVTWAIGANDVANTFASTFGSHSLKWKYCIVLASIGELIGATFLGSKVITTIATEIVPLSSLSNIEIISIMMSVLVSTGMWVQISSFKGLPVSTTHAIVSSLSGIGLFYYGVNSINWGAIKYITSAWILSPVASGIVSVITFTAFKNLIFESSKPYKRSKIIVAPLLYILPFIVSLTYLKTHEKLNLFNQAIFGLITIALVSIFIYIYSKTESFSQPGPKTINKPLKASSLAIKLGFNPSDHPETIDMFNEAIEKSKIHKTKHQAEISKSNKKSTGIFRTGQVLSSFLASLAHGSNDVSNGVAPVAVILWILSKNQSSELSIPLWLTLLGGLGIVAGIITMGKRVVDTLGTQMIAISPFKGFIIQTSTSIVVFSCSILGLPVSTSHAIVGAIVGTHLSNKGQNINGNTLINILLAWMFTVPICMISAIPIKMLVDFILAKTYL